MIEGKDNENIEIFPPQKEQTENEYLNTQLPENLKHIREKFLESYKPEYDRHGDGFYTQAYFAAKSSKTGSYHSIAKALNLDMLTFQYYMEKYPDFVAHVEMGRIDGRKERLADLESSILTRALGMEIEETKTEDSGEIDEDGNFKNSYRKIVTVKKQIPPDTQAALEILRRVDPNWNPKSTIDVNLNQTMHVTEDVNINVDLRELSPSALKEILNSNKQTKNWEINRTPDGESVRFLADKSSLQKKKEKPKNKKSKEEKDKTKVVKKRTMSPETKAKISEALKKRKLLENKDET